MAVQFKNEGSKENKKKEKVNKRNETLFPWMDLTITSLFQIVCIVFYDKNITCILTKLLKMK